MTNLTNFCTAIQHSPHEEKTEQADCKAIKFDDSDGFVESLTANYANSCRVDYFEVIEDGLIMIELKRIKLKIQNLLRQGKTKKDIRNKVLTNIAKKFQKSLSIIQSEINPDLIPTINYLVVDNDIESVILDKYLPNNLREEPFVICKTNEICDKLSKFDTRLCPE
ncbi:MAG: hypothetical protein HAW58_04615 [Candidatus Thioglobus sp.]|nr:hypothetical protein [Candidatus Thioglobus sp.]